MTSCLGIGLHAHGTSTDHLSSSTDSLCLPHLEYQCKSTPSHLHSWFWPGDFFQFLARFWENFWNFPKVPISSLCSKLNTDNFRKNFENWTWPRIIPMMLQTTRPFVLGFGKKKEEWIQSQRTSLRVQNLDWEKFIFEQKLANWPIMGCIQPADLTQTVSKIGILKFC